MLRLNISKEEFQTYDLDGLRYEEDCSTFRLLGWDSKGYRFPLIDCMDQIKRSFDSNCDGRIIIPCKDTPKKGLEWVIYKSFCDETQYIEILKMYEKAALSNFLHKLPLSCICILTRRQPPTECKCSFQQRKTIETILDDIPSIQTMGGLILKMNEINTCMLNFNKGKAARNVCVLFHPNMKTSIAAMKASIEKIEYFHPDLTILKTVKQLIASITISWNIVVLQQVSYCTAIRIKEFSMKALEDATKDLKHFETFFIQYETNRISTTAIDSEDCCICLVKKSDSTILPCLHKCICHSCRNEVQKNLKTCPICRSLVTQFFPPKFLQVT